MILLSSYERIRRTLCAEDTAMNQRVINQYLYAISNNIQQYLNVDFELESATEYFDIKSNQTQFWVEKLPIVSITSVYYDSLGLFDGSETALTNNKTDLHDRSVIISSVWQAYKKCIRIIYTGGISSEPTKSTFALSASTGTFVVDKFAMGATSGAMGIIKAFTAQESIQIDNLYGAFLSNENITMQATEGGADVTGISATIESITTQSLVEQVPEIAMACELQIRYNVQTMKDFENKRVTDKTTERRDTQTELTFRGAYQDLQPEVRSLINGHRRIVL